MPSYYPQKGPGAVVMSVFSSDWVDMFWKKGRCLPPKKPGYENELYTAWTSMPSHLHHPSRKPQSCQTAPFLQARRLGRWQSKQEEWKLRPLTVISLRSLSCWLLLIVPLFQQLILAVLVGSFLKWKHSCSSGCNTMQGFWAPAEKNKKETSSRRSRDNSAT